MCRLIKAYLYKMTKSKMFWFAVIFQAVFALVVIIPTGGTGFSIGGNILFADSLMTLFLSAFFVHFFLHADFHEGMTKNKITVGHTRGGIYLAGCVSAVIGSCVIFLVPVAVSLVLAPFMGGVLGVTAGEFAVRMAVLLAANAAMCAVYVLAAFLFRNMGAAVSAGAALVMFTVSVMCMLYAEDPAEATELFEAYKEVGIEVHLDEARADFLLDVLPTSHMFRAMIFDDGFGEGVTSELPLYSLLVIVVMAAVGVLLFRKKDIK